MSSHTTYVGPYVVAKCHKMEQTREMHTCTNEGCPKHGLCLSTEFCPGCGNPIGDCQVKEDSVSVGVGDMIETLGEKMVCHSEYTDTCHQWISNLTTMDDRAGRPLGINDEQGDWPLTQARIDDELAKFRELHEFHIDKLKAAYDEVEVLWGILAYWN